MNYTRPNDPDHEDSPEDWLSGATIFARALSLMLRENEGIVVDLKGDMKFTVDPTARKLIVFLEDRQIKIIPCEEDLPEGQMVWLDENEDDMPDFDINLN